MEPANTSKLARSKHCCPPPVPFAHCLRLGKNRQTTWTSYNDFPTVCCTSCLVEASSLPCGTLDLHLFSIPASLSSPLHSLSPPIFSHTQPVVSADSKIASIVYTHQRFFFHWFIIVHWWELFVVSLIRMKMFKLFALWIVLLLLANLNCCIAIDGNQRCCLMLGSLYLQSNRNMALCKRSAK